MKALVFFGPRDIRYEEVKTPEPKNGEVRIRVKAVSICGSDIAGYKGISAMRTPGLIMGHEFSGLIEKIGEDVIDFEIGQRVTAITNLYCGKCSNCKSGLTNICINRAIIGTTMPKYGPYNGAMADYLIVPAKKIIMLPDHVSFNEAALTEPLSISLHAIKNAGSLRDKTIAVFGSGPIGLLTIQCIYLQKPAMVIAIDIQDERLEMAKLCGATYTINSGKRDLYKMIATKTKGVGVDVICDAVGIEETINSGIEIVRGGGKIIWIGLSMPKLKINYKKAVCKEIKFITSYLYTSEMEEAIDLIASSKIDVEKIITGIYPMGEGAKLFEDIVCGKSKDIKIILTNK